MKRRVQTRLLLVFGGLMTSVLLVAFTIVWLATSNNFHKQISAQLEYTGDALTRQYSQRSESILRETKLLSRDFGFRSAVASGDQNTIDSALINFQKRISLDRMQVYDIDGQMLADTMGGRQFDAAIISRETRSFSRGIMLGTEVYHMAVVPVMAPDLIGWIVGGVRIDNTLASEHRKLLPGTPEVSFMIQRENGSMELLGTTLPQKQRRQEAGEDSYAAGTEHEVVLDNENFLIRTYVLEEVAPGVSLLASVYLSLDDAYTYLNRISLYFILVGIFGLLLVFAGAYLISRNFMKPIHQLADAAERIQSGDYSLPVPNERADEFGFLATCFSQMASAIEEREHRIREQGMQDALTGLPNRLYIEAWLSKHMATAGKNSSVSVALVSIERLDEVNYVLGHDVADHVITAIGKMLDDVVRTEDVIARVGTDTFGIAIPDMTPDEIMPIVNRVLDLFRTPVRVDDFSIDVTCCVGIAVYPDHAGSARDLLRAAEQALFVSHEIHERYAFYEPGRDATNSDYLSLMGDLRSAIDRNELEVWYQPQVAADNGEFSRVEALVRWPHPVRGMILPDMFIPLAERTGEIHRLTRWVLETSLIQIADWRARGLDLQVSVNLSARDLMNRELPTMISDLLRKCGIRPDRLCVEITESAVMGNTERVISVLQVLRDTGIQIAIDDFGTGYSSLEYLARLPVTELKIDRAFVQNLAERRSDQIIVKSAIELGHGLGLTVVSEGVEDARAMDVLQAYGCDLLQGYFIGKPMPATELEVWFDNYHSGTGKDMASEAKADDSHKAHG